MDRSLPPPSMPYYNQPTQPQPPWTQQAQRPVQIPPPPPPRNTFQHQQHQQMSIPPPPPPKIQPNLHVHHQHPNIPARPPPPPPPPKKQHISAPPFHRPPHMAPATAPNAQMTSQPQLMMPNQPIQLAPIPQVPSALQVPGRPFIANTTAPNTVMHQVSMAIPPPFIPGQPNIIPGVVPTNPMQSTLPIHRPFHQEQKVAQMPIPTQQHISPHKPNHKKSIIDSSWTEHTAPSGLKYYYNSITKESTYIRPPGFQGPQQQQAQKKEEPTTFNQKWIEYEDPATGKKYYSNGSTTTWEQPTTFQPAVKTSNTTIDMEKMKKPQKPKKEEIQNITYSSKEEAITAFKGLLLAKDITPTMKFQEVQKLCSHDIRWDACKTLGERKQALAEYQTKLQKETKELKREELKRAKDAFYKLLTDNMSKITPFTKYKDVNGILKKDERFFAIDNETLREELFYDFCSELKKREDRKKRLDKKNAIDGFKSFLSDCYEERGLLTLSSTWSSFKTSLLSSDYNNDPRYKSKLLSDEDKNFIFSDYTNELQDMEEEKRHRIREARERAEKHQRNNYRTFLYSLLKDGKVRCNSVWRDVQDVIEKDESYKFVKDQGVDEPRRLFNNLLDDVCSVYRRDKSLLSRVISNYCHDNNISLDCSDMTFEEFSKFLVSASSDSNDVRKILSEEPISSARLYYIDMTSNRSNNKKTSNKRADEDSSEDEGEIVEDGEVREDEAGDGSKKRDRDDDDDVISAKRSR